MKKKNIKKKNSQNNFSKLSVFQNQKYKFKKKCPLSGKGAPVIDYKNIKLLKRYISENGKILPSRITSVSQKKQRDLSLSIKKSKKFSIDIMKVILLENVRKVGSIGEIIDVKRGYARNFLIAQKKALFASKDNIKEVEKIKNELNKKDLDKRNSAKEIDNVLRNKEYSIKKLSTENRELYGSVKPTEISKVIKDIEKLEINPSMIQPAEEIKTLGIFNVVLNLHSEVQSQIKIKVESQEENT